MFGTKCPKCQEKSSKSASYCSNCGHEINAPNPFAESLDVQSRLESHRQRLREEIGTITEGMHALGKNIFILEDAKLGQLYADLTDGDRFYFIKGGKRVWAFYPSGCINTDEFAYVAEHWDGILLEFRRVIELQYAKKQQLCEKLGI